MNAEEQRARLDADLSLTHPSMHALWRQACAVVVEAVPQARAHVMYGGLLFAAPEDFCGVFAYAGHVSVEFGRGAELADPFGVLEGKGRFRRHIKLRAMEDIATRHLREYILQAHVLSST
ncbi:MAG: DUF1801 domain-containing protein [Halothiobacillaceae bacterium]|nr:DUF1801 domain-containing protein [Halothiobacillaceae bacterium]